MSEINTITPTGDRVIIRRDELATATTGGIQLPTEAQEDNDRGEVLSVGPGLLLNDGTRRPQLVAVGDRVLFGKFAGATIKMDGKEYLVMSGADVLAVEG